MGSGGLSVQWAGFAPGSRQAGDGERGPNSAVRAGIAGYLLCRACRRSLTINTATAVFPQLRASGRGRRSASPQTRERAGAPPDSGRGLECFRFPPRRPRPGPAHSRPRPAPRLGGARARAGGGGLGRIAGEIPRRGSRARPRPGPQRPPGPPGSAMIKAILIFNNHGKPRLSKFYQPYSEDTQQQIIRETFHLVSKRDENVCNFLEGGLLIGGSDNKLIYRHYATLYFVFCVDSSESELGILDLIQVFVETLDKCFENVCELDLIFHVDKVHNILAEMVMGGMVLETNMNEIVTQIDAQNKLEKSEQIVYTGLFCISQDFSQAGLAGAPARAVSAVKNMNLPEIPRNINIGDISIKVPNLPSFK
ncbi:AP-3 complex subunit sigma-1 isoform X1 [Myotis daubentonii]|uniref:AP-3 complex subunit sigma-1 isoform X1 n=1 Tax=Myotis daubentonii TaxID=98922 RepID=UPI00287320E4|nr:AP-3 complex subunit sigma-1 isoform X1 [Myotis daubentonii]